MGFLECDPWKRQSWTQGMLYHWVQESGKCKDRLLTCCGSGSSGYVVAVERMVFESLELEELFRQIVFEQDSLLICGGRGAEGLSSLLSYSCICTCLPAGVGAAELYPHQGMCWPV